MSAVEGFCFSSCGAFCGKGFITSCCSGLLVRWKISSFSPHIIQQCLTSDCPVTALTYVTYVMCYHYFIKKTLSPATSYLCHDNLECLQVSKCLYTLCLFVCCYHLYVLVTVPLLLCTYLVEFDIIKGPEIVLRALFCTATYIFVIDLQQHYRWALREAGAFNFLFFCLLVLSTCSHTGKSEHPTTTDWASSQI